MKFSRRGLPIAATVLAATGLVITIPAPAQAIDGCRNEANTGGSVDGRQIRYQNHSQYSQFYTARDDWNALGRVSILADTATTVNDLDISDVNRSDVTWSGQWRSSAGEDNINFNIFFLRNYSSAKRRAVAGHELGHALKLGHFDNRNALMHCNDNRNVSTPQTPDRTKYTSIWG